MSLIFQSYAVWPHKTVFENVAYGLRVMNLQRSEIEDRTREVLRSVRMAELADRYPSELSGGQQQRVALARAVVVKPETLLLDEPLSNLDANLREEMRFEIRRIHDATGITMVYVTHDQTEAMVAADRIALMRAGKIAQVGLAGGQQVKDQERGRRGRRQHTNPGLCWMDAHLQRVEIETAGAANDDLAVSNGALRQCRAQWCQQLREVALKWLALAALEMHRLTIAEDDTPEAVPFRLVEEPPRGDGVLRSTEHRFERRLEGQHRGAIWPTTTASRTGQPEAEPASGLSPDPWPC